MDTRERIKLSSLLGLPVSVIAIVTFVSGHHSLAEFIGTGQRASDPASEEAPDPCFGLPIVHQGQGTFLAKGKAAFQVLPGEASGCLRFQVPMNKIVASNHGGSVWVECLQDGTGIPVSEASDKQGVGSLRLVNDGKTPACIWYETIDTHAHE